MRTTHDIYAYVGFIYCELSVSLVSFSLIHLITHAHCRTMANRGVWEEISVNVLSTLIWWSKDGDDDDDLFDMDETGEW